MSCAAKAEVGGFAECLRDNTEILNPQSSCNRSIFEKSVFWFTRTALHSNWQARKMWQHSCGPGFVEPSLLKL